MPAIKMTPNTKRILVACVLITVTLFFRLYRVADIPFGINNDAIWEGSAARAISQGNWKDYIPYAAGWHGEPLIRAMIVILTPFLGDTPTTIKIASVVFGILLIPFLYKLLISIFTWNLAFLTTWFVATSGWHIIMSRSGWRAIIVPTITTFVFLALFYALQTRKILWYIISGIALGAMFYAYDAARIFPIIIAVALTIAYIRSPSFRTKHARGFVFLFFSFVITIIPMTLYASSHWDYFAGRSQYLFVGQKVMKEQSLLPLVYNIRDTALLFTYRGNGNDFFINDPLLDPPASWLFPIGFILGLWHGVYKKKRSFQFMLAWFFLGITPALMSEPNGNRALGALPSVYFFAAFAAAQIIKNITHIARSHKPFIRYLLLFYIVCLSAITTYITYLGPIRRQPPGFYPETYILSTYLQAEQRGYDLYITDNFPREILTYFLYRGGDPFEPTYTWFSEKEAMLTVKPNVGKGIIFALADTQINRDFIPILLNRFPKAHFFPLSKRLDALPVHAAIIVEVPAQ